MAEMVPPWPDRPRPSPEEFARYWRLGVPFSKRIRDVLARDDYMNDFGYLIVRHWGLIEAQAFRDRYVRRIAKNVLADYWEALEKARMRYAVLPEEGPMAPDDPERRAIELGNMDVIAQIVRGFAASGPQGGGGPPSRNGTRSEMAWAWTQHRLHDRTKTDLGLELGLGVDAGRETVARWIRRVDKLICSDPRLEPPGGPPPDGTTPATGEHNDEEQEENDA